ncbi:HD-GYP domain-containing protein [Amantichitinum ursilacus]|uniref:Cyclic di-GMP phosphodiesterase response regulator RpfG n=1 Tax=Amantichitinum ursilacus TaxID=857265 RepID=A0A0N0XII8_9NEIS|nr:HD domain-containing phosphohydrolase [Amantichitinum ursilacus]KPC52731.1 Cyclic di-GMP phosphodiesterase response regulator RpfG [Amantichitinum ursilacus]
MDLLTRLLISLITQAALVEARDAWAGGHLWRVSQLARRLALDLKLPAPDVAQITLGALVHDLGKIGVAETILNKPTRLSDEEFDAMRAHPETGLAALVGHPLAHLVRESVLMHHETPDGTGYPQGLQGDALPLVARIVGLVDAFDAMTSTRSYRRQLGIEPALQAIEDNIDTQFDGGLARHFIKMARAGAFDDIAGHSEKGIAMQHCPTCGPIIAIPHKTRSGDVIACPACRTGFKVLGNANDWHLRPLPVHISARPLSVDHELVQCLAQEIRAQLDERVALGVV